MFLNRDNSEHNRYGVFLWFWHRLRVSGLLTQLKVNCLFTDHGVDGILLENNSQSQILTDKQLMQKDANVPVMFGWQVSVGV